MPAHPSRQRMEAILNHKHEDAEVAENDRQSKSIVLYDAAVPASSTANHERYHEYYCNDWENDDEDKYPDLRHSLFDDEEDRDELDLGDPNGSVIDLMRNSKEEGEDFKLEDEIDQAADLFILKFHKRMKFQKLESFKRFQEMLQRGI